MSKLNSIQEIKDKHIPKGRDTSSIHTNLVNNAKAIGSMKRLGAKSRALEKAKK